MLCYETTHTNKIYKGDSGKGGLERRTRERERERERERKRERGGAYTSLTQRHGEEPKRVYITPWHKELTHSPILFSSVSDKGVDAEEAKARINKDMPGLHVIVLPKVRTEKKKGETACVFIL